MSSPPSYARPSTFRRGSFLLLQDEPPLAPKPSALATLVRNRSAVSLHNPFAHDEEEGGHTHHTLPHGHGHGQDDDRRMSAILNGPHMRSMRLIGSSNPRYRWERYWKTDEQLAAMKKPLREYHERCNYLVQQYLYIDRLLDSSLPHDLLNEYNDMPASAFRGVEVPATISEEAPLPRMAAASSPLADPFEPPVASNIRKVRRTPKDIYRPTETTPLFDHRAGDEGEVHDPSLDVVDGPKPEIPWLEDDQVDSDAPIVTLAIYINFAANAILLAGKLAVVVTVPSVSVLASLVDAVLDFLSTAIVWVTTWLISRHDQYRYPVGRRRLEPLGVLVFSVIMVTSFVQVALQAIQHLASPDHEIIELGIPAIAIMLSTVVVKGMCWFWFRLVRNSSVQALASDASTDVIFNAGSIAFPIIGFYARIWWLDALGGLLLSLVVIFNWSQTSSEHIRHLSGFSATADERNILLYLTMRFAKTIKQIQGLQAYHAGDKLNVEVDIVLDASTSLKDSHDLSESLQYVLESVPIVDRAFVHVDYASYNLPTHMQQQAS
ncbi:hypothetical protein B0H63DRAFT_517644 [Podospora didyma]|uniref:Cation efflux protein transmembrane domain-containing protein n=1 Tax=Podospora didyma TaxID=330526 RepID=A0AAE0U851_9PEZI|nr:hypothetical protein B0H63DRAFT_517644 [Podospora didyma]